MAFYDTITEPAIEPVTLAEAKEHAIIDESLGTDDDVLITALIVAARRHVELLTRKALITRTMTMTLDRWSSRNLGANVYDSPCLPIKRNPFQSVTKVETLDDDGAATEWASSNYYSNPDYFGGVLASKSGSVWPTVERKHGGIKITFTAGYGDAASDVPEGLKTAIKMLVAHWYEHREAVAIDKDAKPAISAGVPSGFDAIISSYREKRIT